ncbi:GNAT family N-acetyltransferase [Vibrio aerogenes]|nr:GNAT family N-acetyltransferase [Vibrio aerogenes]
MLWQLFYHTVRHINIRDYSPAQTQAWAPEGFDMAIWQQKMDDNQPVVAEINGTIVGYTDLQPDGLIDHFFCHHQYQGLGVGTALMQHVLETGAKAGMTRFYSEVSLTARPFYEHMGFSVVRENACEIRGQILNNFLMEKVVSDSAGSG